MLRDGSPIPLYVLGGVDWLTTQTLYHGLAALDEEAVILCWPTTPYVSLGCHQDGEEFDASCGLTALRRRVGGSLVYLDDNQVFFQVILDPSRLPIGRRPQDWYHLALEPVAAYLQRLGLTAEIRPPADILVGSRKISGNAGGQIDDMVVIVGNLLLDFPYDRMVEARYAPNPVMREAFRMSLAQHLITLHDFPGLSRLTREEVMEGLADAYSQGLGAHPSPPGWERWAEALAAAGQELSDPAWLSAEGYRLPYHQIKVREAVYLRALRVAPGHPLADVVVEVHTDTRTIHRVWGCDDLKRVTWPQTFDHLGGLPVSEALFTGLLQLAGHPVVQSSTAPA